MTRSNSFSRDDFGYNLHTIHDIRMIVDVMDNGPLGADEHILPTDYEIPDSASSVEFECESGLVIWLNPNPPKRCALALTPGLMGKGGRTG